MRSIAQRRAPFRQLHQAGCFVLPNPWDGGSAIRLARLGFQALASSSAGAAWALGKADGEMSLEEVLSHLRFLFGITESPVNVDFEAGFANSPDGVARNMTRCIDTGVAGLGWLIGESAASSIWSAAILALSSPRVRSTPANEEATAPSSRNMSCRERVKAGQSF